MPTKAPHGVYDTSEFYLVKVVNLGGWYENGDLPDLSVDFDDNTLEDWMRLDERNLSSCI